MSGRLASATVAMICRSSVAAKISRIGSLLAGRDRGTLTIRAERHDSGDTMIS